jgi:cytochrome c biogenesis protein CcdA
MKNSKEKHIKYNAMYSVFLIITIFFITVPKIQAEYPGGNIVYFFTTGCASCGRVDSLVGEAEGRIAVARYNVMEKGGVALFEKYCDFYNVPKDYRVTPVIFAGQKYFMGIESIEKDFPEYARAGYFVTELFSAGENTDVVTDRFRIFSLLGAVLTGMLNGLNPCSLSILILLATLVTARELKILQYGLLYCAGKILTYFGIGTIFFTFFSEIGFEQYLWIYRLVMTIICLFFIGFNASDFLAAHREDYGKIRLQLPIKIKGVNFSLVKYFAAVQDKRILPVLCFAAGVITSVGEFFCTGQIYIATILSMIHHGSGNRNRALLFLFVYSLGFIVPFLGITLVLHKGVEFFDVSDFIRRHTQYIKAFNVLIFFGILILVWIF